MTRVRRLWRLAPLVGLALVGLILLSIRSGGTGSRAPAELARSQWERLTRRVAHAAEEVRTRGRDRTPRAVDAAASARNGSIAAPPGAISVSTALAAPVSPALGAAAHGSTRPPREGLPRELLERQGADYDARRPKSVVELQTFRRTDEAPIADAQGRGGRAELINLNPRVNSWYLLRLTWDGAPAESYHLTNVRPESHELGLDASFPGGLVIDTVADSTTCDLWSTGSPSSLDAASRLSTPYVTLCEEEVVLRRPTAGRRTRLEWASDFLRDNIWGGEALTVLVRDNLYSDAHLMQSELIATANDPHATPGAPESIMASGVPRPAGVEASHAGDLLAPVGLGLALDPPRERVQIGAWYAARDNPGVFVSALEPGLAAVTTSDSAAHRASRLDEVEAKALTYLVAFDLSRFELGFAIGTDHPRVDWSERVQPGMRDRSLPGPDGIGDIAPLVAGGIVPFSLAERTVATFTGGFKRSHGAFKSGALAQQNSGSHYGFVESGVVLSKLQPGLATIYVLDDGTVEMKTWSRDDDALLERIAFARQNGVPLVERDPADGAPRPGALVSRWGDGNWSGSEDRRLRSVRAGICLQESAAGRFLLYGYFSSATPSAMARVFQAYDCSYGMLTDMNALEHTYLALYRVEASRLAVDHLIQGMEVLDQVVDGQTLPRFLGFADNRDFFYVVRRPSVREQQQELTAHEAESTRAGEGR